MRRDLRLSHTLDIQRVRREGKSFAHPLFVMIVLPAQEDVTRIGVIATKSVGGAVERNRSKRLLRAAADELAECIAPGNMMLLIARKHILDTDTPEVRDVLVQQLMKANIYTPTE